MKKRIIKSILIMAVLGSITACGDDQKPAFNKPIATYKVLNLEKTDATIISEYPASLEGVKDIDIRSKIDGFIDDVLVDEGQEVKKGQLLFRIYNPQYSQDMESLAAVVVASESAVSTAQVQVTKTKPLVEKGIISSFELQNVELALQARKAELESAKARYTNAVANVGYTQISSPVNGVVGSIPYRMGSYVNSSTTLPLTRVSDISAIYAYFSINEKEQLNLFDQLEGTTFQEKIESLPKVNLILSNGKLYQHKGDIVTFSGLINKQTGSFNVRANFPNPEKLLRSGSSATIQLPNYLENVIVIPQKATIELQDRRMAYIIDENNQVKAVPVTVKPVSGGKYFVVEEGLTTKDKLIIEGIGILTEGTTIQPEFVKMADFLIENK